MAKKRGVVLLSAVAVCLLVFLPATDADHLNRRKVLQQKPKDAKCGSGLTKCKLGSLPDVCANTTSDVRYCGSCTNACKANQACITGVCTDIPASPSPSPGATPVVCGAVGAATCASGGPACCVGLTCCSGTCVNTSSSTPHCGGCSKPCMLSGQVCTSGVCVTPSSQITSITLGPYNTCNATGVPTARVPRCLSNGATQVPGVVVNVTTTMFMQLNIKPYTGTASLSGCLRASLCAVVLPAGTQLDLAWVKPPAFTLPSPTGAWPTCASSNCPNTNGTSNIIAPNTGSATGETLQIQSSNGNCVSGIVIILRFSPDCLYNTTFVGPL